MFLWLAKALNPHSKTFVLTQLCSEGVHAHSKAFVHTQLHSGGVHTHSKALKCTPHSRHVQYTLKEFMHTHLPSECVHTHSKAFMHTRLVLNVCAIVFNTHSKGFNPQKPNRCVLKM